MGFHGSMQWDLMIPVVRSVTDTDNRKRDLVDTVAEGKSQEREEVDMVRMFRRLLRTGTKQRVVGSWIF